MVVEDHFLVRMGLLSATEIEGDLEVVAQAENGRQAMDQYRKHRPDVVIMDLRLPDMSGLDAAAGIRAEFPDARILVLSSFGSSEDVYRALQAGVRGYILKDMPREHLLQAIRAVHQGQRFLPPELATRLAEQMNQTALTPRELEVLALIARGMTNKEIANSLGITEGTVKAHVVNLMQKLEVADRTQAVTLAIRRGILRID
jgi:DNA-binding NarL/FixJ family response regulator